jgi:catechol 2,3-dioxygenase-like lactoylglutathione lyase family enzyme
MEPRLNVITLAVEDLERALRFYRDGFQSPGVIGSEWTDERTGANGAITLFELEGGLASEPALSRKGISRRVFLEHVNAEHGSDGLAPAV